MQLATNQSSRELLRSRYAAQIERLIAWCDINSGSDNLEGLNRMCEEITSLFSPLADKTQEISPEAVREVDEQGNNIEIKVGNMLYFRKRPELKKRVLLVGHMDTVFAIDSSFQKCQWLDKNTLNGPGVADMKGGLLVIYEALRLFEESAVAPTVGWDLLITGDEETSSRGSAKFIHQAAQEADIGLVYEPAMADGTLSGQRKGTGNFALVIRGRSAHAGREFELGRNAIAMAANLMTKLHQLNAENPDITINLGRINAGDALNKVPDLAIVRFNARIKTPEDQDWLQKRFAEIVAEANSADGYSASLEGSFTRPPKVVDTEQKRLNDLLVNTGKELDIAIQFVATGGCCDGNNLKAAGLSNIDTMGVRGGNIHSDQEFLLVDSLAERAELSLKMLESWAVAKPFRISADSSADKGENQC
jgi:glutamate carboxypeptidase